LLVWHPGSKKSVLVRINNSGPYWGDRKLDLSQAAAERLGISGVSTVHTRVISAPTAAEAKYSKGRTYAPVRGYIGAYASLDAAEDSLSARSRPTRVAADVPKAKAAPVVKSAPAAKPATAAKPTPTKTSSLPASNVVYR
jgi:rare lipoprotein A